MSWFAIRQYSSRPTPRLPHRLRQFIQEGVLARVTRGRAFRNDAIDHALGSRVVQLGAATYNSTPEPWLDIVTKGAICIQLILQRVSSTKGVLYEGCLLQRVPSKRRSLQMVPSTQAALYPQMVLLNSAVP